MKNILVTGGAGYIGSHTVKELLKTEYYPIVLDDLSGGHRDAVLGGEFIEGDLADKKKLKGIFKKHSIDSVIHFAASIEVGESVKNPSKYFQNNIVAGLNLLDIMIENRVKKMVFSSSAAVYGEPKKIPIEEDDPTIPTNPYGLTKLMFEQILETYDVAYGLKSVSLRYFNAAGADPEGKLGPDHRHKTHLITVAMLVVLKKLPRLEIYGTDYPTPDGTCIRDYIHVTDLAKAHILALKYLDKNKKSGVYNLGNEKGNSVREVVETVKKVTEIDFPVIETKRRAGDPPKLVASSKKIKKDLGWEPRYADLKTIIKSAWNWHKSHPEGFNK